MCYRNPKIQKEDNIVQKIFASITEIVSKFKHW